mgnify:CR=1 FL=1
MQDTELLFGVGDNLTYNLLLKLVAELLESDSRTNAEHYACGAGKEIECFGGLRFGILSADDIHCRVGATTHHILNLCGFGSVECNAEYVTHDMLIHIIKSALSV